MDNYIKHLLNKMPITFSFNEEKGEKNILIHLNKLKNNDLKQIKNISEMYRITSEIVEYLEKNSKVEAFYSADEILIKY
jgi:hypothetical protein